MNRPIPLSCSATRIEGSSGASREREQNRQLRRLTNLNPQICPVPPDGRPVWIAFTFPLVLRVRFQALKRTSPLTGFFQPYRKQQNTAGNYIVLLSSGQDLTSHAHEETTKNRQNWFVIELVTGMSTYVH